jgi:hypothetical protein
MLLVRWESAERDRYGSPVVEEFQTSKDVSIGLNDHWLTLKTIVGNTLLLSVPTWRIIDITTD